MPNSDASARAAALAFALAMLCGDALAQVLYKWVDAQGKTQYSDRPPKNFSGEVMRIEPDEQPATVVPRAIQKPAAKPAEAAQDGVAPDSVARRRELRRKLEADVANARLKLASAKEALEAASSPNDEERQVIQQKVEKGRPSPGAGSASTGGMLGSGGMLGGAPRSNCRTVKGNDGRTITTCPTMVPNDAYYDRVKQLEDAVKAAEEELSAAELAYRRGAD